MTVGEVIETAKEWVEKEATQVEGFRGAHLAGSIIRMPERAVFPLYRDVDIFIVLEGHEFVRQRKFPYKGLILESVYKYMRSGYESPEDALSNPVIADNLGSHCIILSDPTGMLDELHQAVTREFARRKWVKARCHWEREFISWCFRRMEWVDSPLDKFGNLRLIVQNLSGLLAIAHLRPPTGRRGLILTKELLQARGDLALYETLLEVYGCVNIGRDQAIYFLQECAKAFDRAVEVVNTPFPGDYYIHPCVRPYLVDGTMEVINEGYHREAMFWIGVFYYSVYSAIKNDAPEEEALEYQKGFDSFLGALGLYTPDDWQFRLPLARNAADQFYKSADETVQSHPDIED